MTNEEKRRKALEWLGTRWILHPANRVQRKTAPAAKGKS